MYDDGRQLRRRRAAIPEPKRTYKALEFMIDRAWDDHWSFNAVVHAVVQQGQCRRTGQLGHQLRRHGPHRGVRRSVGELRRRTATCRTIVVIRSRCAAPTRSASTGEFGATLTVQSGRPISAIGVGNPFDDTVVPQLLHLHGELHAPVGSALRAAPARLRRPHAVDLRPRRERHLPSTRSRRPTCSVKLAVYNLLNQQRALEVDEILGSASTGAATRRATGSAPATRRRATALR